jgi:uncharacterized protein YwgA
MKTIIKGAIYEINNGETLLRPHYSGNFSVVDCTEYKQKKQIKEDYNAYHANRFLSGFYLTYEGNKYYECEYSPRCTDDMYLLSDIDKINYWDEETEF